MITAGHEVRLAVQQEERVGRAIRREGRPHGEGRKRHERRRPDEQDDGQRDDAIEDGTVEARARRVRPGTRRDQVGDAREELSRRDATDGVGARRHPTPPRGERDHINFTASIARPNVAVLGSAGRRCRPRAARRRRAARGARDQPPPPVRRLMRRTRRHRADDEETAGSHEASAEGGDVPSHASLDGLERSDDFRFSDSTYYSAPRMKACRHLRGGVSALQARGWKVSPPGGETRG